MKLTLILTTILISNHLFASDFDAAAVEACNNLQISTLTELNKLNLKAADIEEGNSDELDAAMDKIDGLRSLKTIQKKMPYFKKLPTLPTQVWKENLPFQKI